LAHGAEPVDTTIAPSPAAAAAVARTAGLLERLRAWRGLVDRERDALIRGDKRVTLSRTRTRIRRRTVVTLTLPAGATHRSDGRGVDVDAGQGVMLRGCNHHTPGVLAGSS
jgi:hypothetical protein